MKVTHIEFLASYTAAEDRGSLWGINQMQPRIMVDHMIWAHLPHMSTSNHFEDGSNRTIRFDNWIVWFLQVAKYKNLFMNIISLLNFVGFTIHSIKHYISKHLCLYRSKAIQTHQCRLKRKSADWKTFICTKRYMSCLNSNPKKGNTTRAAHSKK